MNNINLFETDEKAEIKRNVYKNGDRSPFFLSPNAKIFCLSQNIFSRIKTPAHVG